MFIIFKKSVCRAIERRFRCEGVIDGFKSLRYFIEQLYAESCAHPETTFAIFVYSYHFFIQQDCIILFEKKFSEIIFYRIIQVQPAAMCACPDLSLPVAVDDLYEIG